MARRKSFPKSPRTVTTRLQAKQTQGNNVQMEVAKVCPRKHARKINMKNRIKFRRLTRKQKRQFLQAAKLNQQRKKQILQDTFFAERNDEELSKRQEFHEGRQVVLSNSPKGKSITITCRNYSEISENNDEFAKNDTESLGYGSEVSTIPVESSSSQAEPSTSWHHDLSPASYDAIELTKKQEFLVHNVSDQKNEGIETGELENGVDKFAAGDDDIIYIDTTTVDTTENVDDDVLIVNDCHNNNNNNLSSLIIIDDESIDENHKKVDHVNNKKDIDIIDLTTLPATPVRPINNVSNFTATAANKKAYSHILNTLFRPVTQLQLPSTSNVRSTNTHGQHTNYCPSDYNLQSSIYGNNFLNVGTVKTTGLRPIFIDGCNVAMQHSNGRYFSVKGIKICIDYFRMRGHEVTAVIPQVRKRRGENSDPKLLYELEKQGLIAFTPSRVINGRHIIPYDDRFVVQMAAVYQGIVVSCDNFRDLLNENPNLRDTIDNRILNPTYVKDMIIFPSDPLGRFGPKLDEFLRFP